MTRTMMPENSNASPGIRFPLFAKHPDFKGSMFKVMVELENGETAMEPMRIIDKDDSVTYAIYVKDIGLLDTPV
jgi:hypothetical protein